jgi:hypothetical protein
VLLTAGHRGGSLQFTQVFAGIWYPGQPVAVLGPDPVLADKA